MKSPHAPAPPRVHPTSGAPRGLERRRRPLPILDGKYQLVRRLGAGGMGIVYEARHTRLDRRFAVKVLKPDLRARPDAVARFEREARVAASFESPYLAPALDIGQYQGAPYILMELLDGESLQARMQRLGRLPVTMAARLLAQACAGLRVAHHQGVVHRDIKPSNLFVCRDPEIVKVLDFGIAKLIHVKDDELITSTGALIGTYAYMAPEQARCDTSIGPEADIYALGTILYEALAGRRPFLGDRPHHILQQILYERPPPLRSMRAEVPPALGDLVHDMLALDPERRPAAEGLETVLLDFARGRDPRLHFRGGTRSASGLCTTTQITAPETRDVPRRTSRTWVRVGLFGTAALVAGLVAGRTARAPSHPTRTGLGARGSSPGAGHEPAPTLRDAASAALADPVPWAPRRSQAVPPGAEPSVSPPRAHLTTSGSAQASPVFASSPSTGEASHGHEMAAGAPIRAHVPTVAPNTSSSSGEGASPALRMSSVLPDRGSRSSVCRSHQPDGGSRDAPDPSASSSGRHKLTSRERPSLRLPQYGAR